MPEAPFLTLVDPRAQRRALVKQRVLSTVIGAVIAGASAIPFALSFMR